MKINDAPSIASIQKSATYTATNGNIQLTCLATDPNADPLTYIWIASGGTFTTTTTRTTTWTAPVTEGVYTFTVTATDKGNLSATATTTVLVKNFNTTVGNIIAYYPFTNHVNDISGNQLNGVASGIAFVPDRNGVPNSAGFFNGGTQNVSVANSPLLNVTNALTASCWFKASSLGSKEVFLMSHGSWQNRWKLSITPEKNLRWTVDTLTTIADLDAPTPFVVDSFYYVTAAYEGSFMTIYINGNLIAYKPLTASVKSISPNPTADVLTIKHAFTGNEAILVRVFDIAGRQVDAVSFAKNQIPANQFSINVSAYQQGTYFLNFVQDGKSLGALKFVKN